MDLSGFFSSQQNLEVMLDSMADAVIAHDLNRRITFFNRAAERLTGMSRNQVLGQDCHRILQGGLCGSRCAFCEECVPDFDLLSYPLVISDRQGRQVQVEMTVVPMKDAQGKTVGALAVARDVTELNQLRRSLRRERSFQGLIGRHDRMQSVYELIREVAATDVPVLIQGESGTGKELAAAAIHSESGRARGPFVPVNCGALPEGLLESELFGHVRGAFTGATRDKRGRFLVADGGTIFLDEVGELSPAIQVKLLRVLQDQRLQPVGSEDPRQVDVRIISATNRDLKEQVSNGRFRQDLYYRLCVVPIELPPLRERRTDIPLLSNHFLRRFCEESGRPVPLLSEAALQVLLDADWPGNVRQLMNALQYALVKTRGATIEPHHLPAELTPSPRPRPGRRRKLNAGQVKKALEKAGGNKSRAAEMLGVGRSTLYRYLGG